MRGTKSTEPLCALTRRKRPRDRPIPMGHERARDRDDVCTARADHPKILPFCPARIEIEKSTRKRGLRARERTRAF